MRITLDIPAAALLAAERLCNPAHAAAQRAAVAERLRTQYGPAAANAWLAKATAKRVRHATPEIFLSEILQIVLANA